MRKIIVSGMIGNGLEWYDYALYGQMAWLISKLFFPEGDPTVTLLATYGIFAAGFIIRPLGGILFGWLGDTYGRKTAMVWAVILMAIPTGLMGVLPTYAEIGILAPILLTVLRLLQGLSLGGEFSGSITYIVEHAPPHRRGFAGVAPLVSLIIGFMLGSFVTAQCMQIFGPAFAEWGWRIPFLIGVPIGLIGFYIRHHCAESPVYEQAKKEGHLSKTPVREAIKHHPWQMLQGFAIYMTVTMPFYLTAIYFIGFTHKHLGLTMEEALQINIYNMLAMLLAKPISAYISDYTGRRPVMMAAALLMCVSAIPLFSYLVAGQTVVVIGMAQFAFALMLGFYIGPIAALLVELFPTAVRFSGMAIAYNLSAAIFGGTAPFVCEWIIKVTGSSAAIAYYVMFCNIASLIALYFYHERHKEPLR